MFAPRARLSGEETHPKAEQVYGSLSLLGVMRVFHTLHTLECRGAPPPRAQPEGLVLVAAAA